jgi:hypothetical protein
VGSLRDTEGHRFPQKLQGIHNMHIKILFAVAALVVHMGPACAQQMYKCGSTFSQTPCGPGATAKTLPSGAVAQSPPGLSGFELCAAAAGKFSGPEPESARIQPLGERKSEIIQYAGKAMATHRYDLGIDAKTQYGVYSGVRPYSCWLSEDQRRVLQFAAHRN